MFWSESYLFFIVTAYIKKFPQNEFLPWTPNLSSWGFYSLTRKKKKIPARLKASDEQ